MIVRINGHAYELAEKTEFEDPIKAYVESRLNDTINKLNKLTTIKSTDLVNLTIPKFSFGKITVETYGNYSFSYRLFAHQDPFIASASVTMNGTSIYYYYHKSHTKSYWVSFHVNTVNGNYNSTKTIEIQNFTDSPNTYTLSFSQQNIPKVSISRFEFTGIQLIED